jgi:hypothetical protein
MRPDPERSGETFEAFVGMLSTGIPEITLRCWNACEFLELSPDSEQAMRLIAGLGMTSIIANFAPAIMARQRSESDSSC